MMYPIRPQFIEDSHQPPYFFELFQSIKGVANHIHEGSCAAAVTFVEELEVPDRLWVW